MSTAPRAVRIPPDVWARVLARAAEEGVTASDVVRDALTRHLKPRRPARR